MNDVNAATNPPDTAFATSSAAPPWSETAELTPPRRAPARFRNVPVKSTPRMVPRSGVICVLTHSASAAIAHANVRESMLSFVEKREVNEATGFLGLDPGLDG